MEELQSLKSRIEIIEQRNQKVELDKTWETSLTRRLLLIMFTYLAIALYLSAIAVPNPWINAVVPAIGFLLSTLTLPFFKKRWQANRKSNNKNNLRPKSPGDAPPKSELSGELKE
jgi:hypothetical protein